MESSTIQRQGMLLKNITMVKRGLSVETEIFLKTGLTANVFKIDSYEDLRAFNSRHESLVIISTLEFGF